MPSNKKIGRPQKTIDKKCRVIKARLTEAEFNALLRIQKESGMNRSELIITKLFHHTGVSHFERKEALNVLDSIGTELRYAGNNINQLAKLSHQLNRMGQLDTSMQSEFQKLLGLYISVQQQLELQLRKLLRELKRR